MSSTIIPQHAEVRVASAVKDLLNKSLSFAKTQRVLGFTPLTMLQASLRKLLISKSVVILAMDTCLPLMPHSTFA